VVTAPPRAPSNLTFHRKLQGGKSTIVVSWAPPTAGQPVPTGSTVTGSGCGTLQSSNFAGARFINVPASKTTYTAGAAAGRRGPPPGTARRRPRARDAPPGPAPAHAADVLLDGLAIRQLEGHTAAAPALAGPFRGFSR
jgi:hypothetical protein